MTTAVRRALMIVPPLVLAEVLLKHPNDEADMIYASVSPVVDDWIFIHITLLLAFPFLALAAFVLVVGLAGRAAIVARVALVFFAVIYTAWEVMVGLSTGILTDYANGLPAAEQAAVAGAIQDFNEHWVTQVALVIGFCGWIVAMVASAIAVRGAAGARWPAGCALRRRGGVCDSPAAHRASRSCVLRCRRTSRRACAGAAAPGDRVDVRAGGRAEVDEPHSKWRALSRTSGR